MIGHPLGIEQGGELGGGACFLIAVEARGKVSFLNASGSNDSRTQDNEFLHTALPHTTRPSAIYNISTTCLHRSKPMQGSGPASQWLLLHLTAVVVWSALSG